MRIVAALLALVAWLNAGEAVAVEDKYKDSSKCMACHSHLVHQWENSWHAKSHYQNDEYFRKTLDFVGRKSRKSTNAVKVQCATCHNPRIAVTSTGMDYEILVAMKLDEGSKVNKALASDVLNEGINCIVCHNIDKIHDNLDESKRGVHRVSWMPPGIMSGPYDDASSPYHQIKSRDFMDNDADKLCFVCHANDRAMRGLVFTNMQEEYVKTDKMCVDCHMGPRIEGVASTLRIINGKPKKREIREHGFIGAHTETMWKGALKIDVKRSGAELLVTLENPYPHNIPSGFGSRELIVEAEYKSGGKVLKLQQMSLTQHYRSRRGKPTVPHLAVESSPDMSVPAHGSRTVKFPLVEGAQNVTVTVSYRLVNDEIRELLELKEPIWSQKMLINKVTANL